MRLVVDMREVNQFMVQKHFKMEGTPTLQDLIRRNDFAISFNLKEAYNHVPVHPTFQNLLGIQFMGTTYTYRGMPKCVMAIREIWRIRCVVYLDDLVLLHPDKNHLEKLTTQITQFLQHFGWTINLEKSHLQPTQQFQYLGWIWDSTTMRIQLPPDRGLRILKELRTAKKRIYKKKTTSVRILATLIEMLSATRIQFPKASLYLK
jgi:hypothetical protein